jgi:hypothetical protein
MTHAMSTYLTKAPGCLRHAFAVIASTPLTVRRCQASPCTSGLSMSVLLTPTAFTTPAASTRLREAWAEYLGQFAWDQFATLTARHAGPAENIVREFHHRLIRRVARAAQQPVSWFYSLERSSNHSAHLHALLWTGKRLSASEVQRSWSMGHSRVVEYDPRRGAAYYVSKELFGISGEFDMSIRLPPRLTPPQGMEDHPQHGPMLNEQANASLTCGSPG